MKLKTPKATVQKSVAQTFIFLTNLKNFQQLMPSDITNFKVDGDSFLFSFSGIPEIRLALKEKLPNQKIVLGTISNKLDFDLTILLEEQKKNTSKAQLFFNGDFNPMMALMIKKPLTNFINTLCDNLEKI